MGHSKIALLVDERPLNCTSGHRKRPGSCRSKNRSWCQCFHNCVINPSQLASDAGNIMRKWFQTGLMQESISRDLVNTCPSAQGAIRACIPHPGFASAASKALDHSSNGKTPTFVNPALSPSFSTPVSSILMSRNGSS